MKKQKPLCLVCKKEVKKKKGILLYTGVDGECFVCGLKCLDRYGDE